MRHPSASSTRSPSSAPAALLDAANPRFEHVPVAELLEPRIPARAAFDDAKLQELCDSLRAFGRVLVPLVVEREGDQMRVHAGHRRMEAAKLVGLASVPCMVYDAGTVPGEAVKSHENAIREDLNVAEEADYFVRLLEGPCDNDVHKLCELVKQKEPYVQQRLALKLGYPIVFDALAAGLISIGVAEEFNKIKAQGYVMQYVQVAAQGGCSIRQARDWRVAANNMPEQEGPAPMPNGGVSPPPPPPMSSQPACIFCGRSDDQHEIRFLAAHMSCQKAAERRAEAPGV